MLVTETQNGYKTQRVCSVLSHSNIGEAEHQTREFREEKKNNSFRIFHTRKGKNTIWASLFSNLVEGEGEIPY